MGIDTDDVHEGVRSRHTGLEVPSKGGPRELRRIATGFPATLAPRVRTGLRNRPMEPTFFPLNGRVAEPKALKPWSVHKSILTKFGEPFPPPCLLQKRPK